MLLLLKEQAAAGDAAAAARAAGSAAPLPDAPCGISCCMAMESVARLAWSDDEVRELLAAAGAVHTLVDIMRGQRIQPSVQVGSAWGG